MSIILPLSFKDIFYKLSFFQFKDIQQVKCMVYHIKFVKTSLPPYQLICDIENIKNL